MNRFSGQFWQVELVQARHLVRQIVAVLKQHMHARLKAGHQQTGGHAFTGDIADQHSHAAVGEFEEIVVVAAHRAARRGLAGDIQPFDRRRGSGQQALLDQRGLLHLLGHGALGFLDLVETDVLDANGGDVGHDREQIEILARKLADQVRRVEIDQPDDAVVGLQGNRDHAADFLLDDAHLAFEALVELGVANQQGLLLLKHAVANGGGDFETFAAGGAHVQLLALQGHQHAASSHHRFHGKIHDDLKKLPQRAVLRKLSARANQGAHLRVALHDGGLIQVGCLGADHGLEIGDDGGRGSRKAVFIFDKYDGLGNETGDVGEFDDEVPRGDAVPGAERRGSFQTAAVQQRAVLAAEILDAPVQAGAGKRHVLARESRVVGIAQLAVAGAAQHDAIAIQGNRDGLALQIAHDQFAGRILGCGSQAFRLTLGIWCGIPCMRLRRVLLPAAR